ERAWRVEDRNSAGLQPLQDVHAEDDLLERAGRHRADHHRVEASERVSGDADTSNDPAEINGYGLVAKQCGGPLQMADVPAGAASKESYAHAAMVAARQERSTAWRGAGFRPAARQRLTAAGCPAGALLCLRACWPSRPGLRGPCPPGPGVVSPPRDACRP